MDMTGGYQHHHQVAIITAELSRDGTFIVVGIVNICYHLYAGYLQLCT
jgi:hypothetical protein